MKLNKGGIIKDSWGLAFASIMILTIVVFVVALFLVKLLWAWTIPDLFPGAVEQGLVVGTISWLTALKVAIFVAILVGVAGARQHKN